MVQRQRELECLSNEFRQNADSIDKLRHILEQLLTIGAEAVPTFLNLLDERILEGDRKDWMQRANIRFIILRVLDYWYEESSPLAQSALISPIQFRRWWAIERLIELNGRSMIPQLRQLLDDSSLEVQLSAIETLGKFGDVESLPRIREFLNDADRDLLWVEAIKALCRLDDRTIIPRLREMLDESDREVRRAVIGALGHFRDKEVVDRLFALFREPSGKLLDYTDSHAIWALDKIDRSMLCDRLIDLLASSDPQQRRKAIKMLGGVGGKDAIPHIQKLRDDPDQYLQADAIITLGRLGDPAVLPDMLKLLTTRFLGSLYDFHEQQKIAIRYFTELGDQTFLPHMLELMKHDSEWLRCVAIPLVATLGGVDILPRLRDMLADPEASVRSAAIETLGPIENPDEYPRLYKLLDDPDGWVQRATMEVIAEIGASDAIPLLRNKLADPDDVTVGHAAEALEKLGDRHLPPEFFQRFANPTDDEKSTFIHALRRLGDQTVTPYLLPFLDDRSEYVREDALQALAQLKATDDMLPRILSMLSDDEVGWTALKTLLVIEGRESERVEPDEIDLALGIYR
ncbi:MAG: HEAT repeat domain-containing protein [Anaerolineae bacterium]|nr:HEAT repeat domain-containing protein [Anaerolineae bacterium]